MFLKIISRLEETVVNLIMVVLVILTFTNVVLRYVFNYSIPGSVEVSILLFAWIVFVGSSVAIKNKTHIKIDLLEAILPKKYKKIVSLLISIMLVILAACMCFYGFIFTYDVMGETLGASNIPKSLVYLAFPIGFGLMGIHLMNQIVLSLKEMW
ncbi:TRAP transporter small permease [Sporosarcina sp. 179-K 3D1 HS]|uniref:TRAP transporter small permease n=1 Tax=Sporosarcina sp. 179-K 3D1 HS TaxID=3232169 RepID=UPI0039A0007C